MSSPASSASSHSEQIDRIRKRAIDSRDDSSASEDESCLSSSSDSDSRSNSPAPEGDFNDVPVLSHAEQRRQKKKTDKELAQSDSPNKKRKLNNGKPASADAKRQNSVWVGNLSFKTTSENIRTFFEGCGEITRVHLPTKPTRKGVQPENRGFAYVDFTTPEGKTAAIGRSEKPLSGRKLLIKDGSDFTGRPNAPTVGEDGPGASVTHTKTAQKILKIQKQPAAPTLFFGNLGFNTTEDSIRQLLEAHRGKDTKVVKTETPPKETGAWIRKIRMGTFEDSGACKGFAFVDFTTVENATTALVNPKNHRLDGRDLVVEYASAEAVRRGAPKSLKADYTKAPPPRMKQPYRDLSIKANDQGEEKVVALRDQTSTPSEDHKEDNTGSGWKKSGRGTARSRPKPGAALALAKRESAAIIPSQSKKITFE